MPVHRRPAASQSHQQDFLRAASLPKASQICGPKVTPLRNAGVRSDLSRDLHRGLAVAILRR
jgi:hypothetical protein